MPKQIGVIKSINNLIGWAKDDSGKWYRFNEIIQDNLQVDNIQVSQIEYKGKKYWGVLSCGRRRDSKKQTDNIEYVTGYWIFDSTIVKEPTYLDTSVHTNIFKFTITSGEMTDSKPVLWTTVLNEFRQCFHNGICLDRGRLFL